MGLFGFGKKKTEKTVPAASPNIEEAVLHDTKTPEFFVDQPSIDPPKQEVASQTQSDLALNPETDLDISQFEKQFTVGKNELTDVTDFESVIDKSQEPSQERPQTNEEDLPQFLRDSLIHTAQKMFKQDPPEQTQDSLPEELFTPAPQKQSAPPSPPPQQILPVPEPIVTQDAVDVEDLSYEQSKELFVSLERMAQGHADIQAVMSIEQNTEKTFEHFKNLVIQEKKHLAEFTKVLSIITKDANTIDTLLFAGETNE